jgi:hypothetical protein
MNRQVDLVGEAYDAAIGGPFGLNPGAVARTLAPARRGHEQRGWRRGAAGARASAHRPRSRRRQLRAGHCRSKVIHYFPFCQDFG